MTNGTDKRWLWWGQARDTVSFLAGLVLLMLEAYRGTYNPTAMGFVFGCWGLATTGVVTRRLVRNWENGGAK